LREKKEGKVIKSRVNPKKEREQNQEKNQRVNKKTNNFFTPNRRIKIKLINKKCLC
jgi:hypothetical protein